MEARKVGLKASRPCKRSRHFTTTRTTKTVSIVAAHSSMLNQMIQIAATSKTYEYSPNTAYQPPLNK